jgi:hypothetical protein
VKPAPWLDKAGWWFWNGPGPGIASWRVDEPPGIIERCPYGAPGDRLWVRETWWNAERYPITLPSGEPSSDNGSSLVHYAADGDPPNTPNRHYPSGLRNGAFAAPDPYACWVKKPSIHMPRWACRLELEIEAVGVEPLHRIVPCDAAREGVGTVAAFEAKWREIYGAESWDANPWVWVLQFRRVEEARDAHA